MGKNKNEIYPWTDEQGKTLELSEIKKRSVSWTADIWNEYLKTLDKGLMERPIPYLAELDIATGETIFSRSQSSASLEMKEALASAILTLSDQQRIVVELIFFKSRSQREVALKLSISQSRVRDLKRAALKKLKSFFQGALTFPLVTTQSKNKEIENVQTNLKSSIEDDPTAHGA